MSSNEVVGLLLAAGFSRRFGASDKRALQNPRGQTLLGASYAVAAEVCERPWVVLRGDDNAVALGLSAQTRIVRTDQAALGQGASLAEGFKALLASPQAARACAAAVFLGDMPFVAKSTCQRLFSHADEPGIVRPVYDGQPGHPVLFGRDFWPELAALSARESGMAVVHRHLQNLLCVAVRDRGVVRDIDTAQEMQLW